MGCVKPLPALHREQFPITRQYIYLNHAAVAPLTLRAANAMKELADDCLHHGANHYDRWMAVYASLRSSAARLIGAKPSEIAIVKNTSEGIATVALGIDWQAGDKIVAFLEEFPANYYPWKRLEERGVHVEWLSIHDPPGRIDAACQDAKLLAVSFVNYLSGHRVDLQAIGDICHSHGTFFLVDAIQGLGVFPIDVDAFHIDALAADGHKWLLGPEGCGILYVRQECQNAIFPMEFGWTNVARYADYASRDMTLRPDAGRYECGTLNTIGCFGLHAAIEFLLEVGVERIAPLVLALATRIAEGAADRGYELAAPRSPATGSGIVSLRKPDIDPRLIVHRLRERGILAAPRQGWVRTSPHFYLTPGDIDTFLAALP